MTKEEILISAYVDAALSLGDYKTREDAIHYVTEMILKDYDGQKVAYATYPAMNQYAQQQSILFAEWIATSAWIKYPPVEEEGKEEIWYMPSNDRDLPDEEVTTSQLYEIFKNTQS